ncbi:unnamed protein product [Phytomonas sp. Hart1]|nr:unnamed protein product [Phytomonas sp. Hart1]|eukprot:CCW69415.1 unnamed protein product [Phytomonas sp. isolate Hart1]
MEPSSKTLNSVVVHTLSEIGSEYCPVLQPMLRHLAGLVLTRRPKDPEQCIIDHLSGKHLGETQTPSNSRLSFSMRDKDIFHQGTQGEEGDVISSEYNEAASQKSYEHSYRQERGTALPLASSLQYGSLKTIAERLAVVVPLGPGRRLLEKLAKLLLDVKPRDAEEYLCTRLEGRCFSEEVVATNAMMHSMSGLLLVPPTDPTEIRLLKGVPIDSPGYAVAANVISLLITKKPSNPINYLFDHFAHRCRSSTIYSVASSNRHHIEEDSVSSVSHNLCCSYADNAEGEAEMEPMNSTDRELCMNNFLKVIHGLTPHSSFDQRRLMSSIGLGRGRTSWTFNRSANTKETGTQTSLYPENVPTKHQAGHGGNNSEPKPGSISSGSPPRFRPVSTFSSAVQSGSVMKEMKSSLSTSNNRGFMPLGFTFASDLTTPQPSNPLNSGNEPTKDPPSTVSKTPSSPSAFLTNSQQLSALSEEQIRICAELDQLRIRGELRQECLRHEIETLRREKEYRENIAVLYTGDSERSAAHAATEALFQAERYLYFLQDHDHQLRRMLQHQLQVLSFPAATFMGHAQSSVAPPQPSSPYHSIFQPRTSVSALPISSPLQTSYCSDKYVLSELEMLRKRVELLTIEQSRLRTLQKGVDPDPSRVCNPYHTTISSSLHESEIIS